MVFAVGESGNPSGKPKGARNRLTVLFEKAMHAEARSAVRAICRKASQGDPEMAALFCQHILPRLAPLRRGAPAPFDLGNAADAADSGATLSAIVRATADGVLTAEEAERIGTVVRAKVESADVAEMMGVLRRLEAGNGHGPSWNGNGRDVAPDQEADDRDTGH